LKGLEERQREIAALMAAVIERALNILPSKLEEANLRDLVLCIAILIDKWLLLQPPETVPNEELSDVELFERLGKLARAIRKPAALQEAVAPQGIPSQALRKTPEQATSQGPRAQVFA
jgi:hypothetical protein